MTGHFSMNAGISCPGQAHIKPIQAAIVDVIGCFCGDWPTMEHQAQQKKNYKPHYQILTNEVINI
jgi:hypothetical protein